MLKRHNDMAAVAVAGDKLIRFTEEDRQMLWDVAGALLDKSAGGCSKGFSADVGKNVMARACKAAGIAHYHPHDQRRRYARVRIAEGVPVTDLAAQLGHSRKS